MRGLRITILLFVFGAAAVTVAGIRVEQARCVARIQRLRLREVQACEVLESLNLRIARLRSPQQIHKRIERFELPIQHPGEEQPAAPDRVARRD